jgi:hypothetical protein
MTCGILIFNKFNNYCKSKEKCARIIHKPNNPHKDSQEYTVVREEA